MVCHSGARRRLKGAPVHLLPGTSSWHSIAGQSSEADNEQQALYELDAALHQFLSLCHMLYHFFHLRIKFSQHFG